MNVSATAIYLELNSSSQVPPEQSTMNMGARACIKRNSDKSNEEKRLSFAADDLGEYVEIASCGPSVRRTNMC